MITEETIFNSAKHVDDALLTLKLIIFSKAKTFSKSDKDAAVNSLNALSNFFERWKKEQKIYE